ncbi:MAG: hypothetical protein OEZ01_16895 [Candidatus Heimdallarchaeota archaeon]|nr:hypothetical protein [Candidatus Heimdallarchaeota archaeon]MDH5647692.1 hypothetical protein [Candidatus Heimdallarchaeota archaeon]
MISIDIQSQIDEAGYNHQTGRFSNSARNFHHVARLFSERDRYEDAIYFFYRSICDFERAGENVNKINKLQELGLYCLKQSTKLSYQFLELDIHEEDKIGVLEKLEQNQRYLENEEERESVIKLLITQLVNRIDESEVSEQQKELYIDKLLNYTDFMEKQQKSTIFNKIKDYYKLKADAAYKNIDYLGEAQYKEYLSKIEYIKSLSSKTVI